MGTGLYIIDAIIIAIVILPFVLFISGSKKKERLLRKALQSEATQHNCNLNKIEVHSNFALGIDSAEQKMFFYKNTDDEAYTKMIDLKSIASCKMIKETRRVKDKTKHYDVIDKLLLSFTHHNHKDISNLEFFNNDSDLSLNGELAIALKWQDEINALLTANLATDTAQKYEQINVAIS